MTLYVIALTILLKILNWISKKMGVPQYWKKLKWRKSSEIVSAVLKTPREDDAWEMSARWWICKRRTNPEFSLRTSDTK